MSRGTRVREDADTAGLRPGRRGLARALEARAREDLALYRRHPWVLQVSGARAVLGPNETALFESSLGTVAGIGLTARELALVVSLIAGYARGAAQGVVAAAQAEQQTGVSDDDWWAAREPVFDRYFDVERFPLLVEMHGSGAFERSTQAPTTTWDRRSTASSSACNASSTASPRSWARRAPTLD